MKNALTVATLVTLLMLLFGGTIVSAQSVSLFGNIAVGTLNIEFEDETPDTKSGQGLQAGALVHLTRDLAIGIMLDRVTSSVVTPTGLLQNIDATLTGYNAILQYNLGGPLVDFGAFGGMGKHDLRLVWTAPGQTDVVVQTEPASGFVAGGQVKLTLNSNVYVGGNATFRAARFTRATATGLDDSFKVDVATDGWSFGVGVGVTF